MTSKSTTQPRITIYRGWEDPGKYVWSPFVTKLELRLRYGGLSYETKAGSTFKAPKGKVPYIDIAEKDLKGGDSESSTSLADSTLIIQALMENGLLEDINASLSPMDRAHDLSLRALLEDKLYFYHTWERWHQNYYTMRGHVLEGLPYPAQILIGLFIYRKLMVTLHGQGTGRFSPEEIAAFRLEIWENIDALLKSSKSNCQVKDHNVSFWLLGGDAPSEVDMILYGFIISVLIATAAPESQKVVKSFPTILDYAHRIHDRYFPDYEFPE